MNPQAPEHIIGVHMGDPMLHVMPVFAPAGNNVGFVLLHRYLELALLAEDLTREECCGGSGAELNDCIFLALVTDPNAAADTLKRALGRVGLLPYAQIGVSEGDNWRCIYPSSACRMGWLMNTERLEHASEQFLRALNNEFNSNCETVRRLLRSLGQQGGEK